MLKQKKNKTKIVCIIMIVQFALMQFIKTCIQQQNTLAYKV